MADRCTAIQKNGTRCKLNTAKGSSKYCFRHKSGKGARKSSSGGRSVGGKKKNPKRVAAGKKAARTRRSAKGGGGYRTGKRTSLSKSLAVVGGVVTITGWGASRSDAFVGAFNGFLSEHGMAAVSGATIIGVAIGLAALATAWKWFGTKYRAFLGTWGLKP